MQVGLSDNSGLQSGVEPIAQVLKKQGFLQETKMPCDKTQGEKVHLTRFEQNHGKPLFSRDLDDSDNGEWRELWRNGDKIELILSLIDSLDYEEKERLFNRLDSVER